MMYTKLLHPASSACRACQPEGSHYFDSAELLARLAGRGRTRAELARTAGLTLQQTNDRLRLMELDEGLRGYLRRENVPEGIALTLLMLPDPVSRWRIARRIVWERLCIRDSRLLVISARRRCKWQPLERQGGQRIIPVIRDVRPFRNAIRDIALQMAASGMRTTFTETRSGSLVELTVAYPVRNRRVQRRQSM